MPTRLGSRPTLTCSTSTGTVLLAVRGLQLGTGVSERETRNRVLNERLLTIEWQQRDTAREEPCRGRNVAAGQHLYHRGCRGH